MIQYNQIEKESKIEEAPIEEEIGEKTEEKPVAEIQDSEIFSEDIIGYDIIQEDSVVGAIELSTESLGGDSLSLVRIIKTLFDRRGSESVRIFEIPELTLPISFEYAV